MKIIQKDKIDNFISWYKQNFYIDNSYIDVLPELNIIIINNLKLWVTFNKLYVINEYCVDNSILISHMKVISKEPDVYSIIIEFYDDYKLDYCTIINGETK